MRLALHVTPLAMTDARPDSVSTGLPRVQQQQQQQQLSPSQLLSRSRSQLNLKVPLLLSQVRVLPHVSQQLPFSVGSLVFRHPFRIGIPCQVQPPPRPPLRQPRPFMANRVTMTGSLCQPIPPLPSLSILIIHYPCLFLYRQGNDNNKGSHHSIPILRHKYPLQPI